MEKYCGANPKRRSDAVWPLSALLRVRPFNCGRFLLYCGCFPLGVWARDYSHGMPLCTEKQARASKYINPLMTELAELCGLQICMSMV